MKVLIVYYSLYGHIHRLARAVADGIHDAGGEAVLRRVPETLSPEVLEKMGATAFQQEFAHVPVCTREDLITADAVIIGTPTRFGNMCGQMRQFFDGTGALWQENALVGKVGSVFTSSATQHGGQESTILSTQVTLFHHGMILVGLPYAFSGQSRLDEITGCSPYGASTIAGGDRWPTKNELAGARWQGKYVALLAKNLSPSRDIWMKELLTS